jgi:hypothetical protein
MRNGSACHQPVAAAMRLDIIEYHVNRPRYLVLLNFIIISYFSSIMRINNIFWY